MTVSELMKRNIFKYSSTEQNAIDFLEELSFDTIKSIGISTVDILKDIGQSEEKK